MSEILLYYRRPDPTTWVYLSSFLTIGLYFVFHRFWSIRNLDILLLILLSPGLLMVHEGRRRQFRDAEAKSTAVPQDGDRSKFALHEPSPDSAHARTPQQEPSVTHPIDGKLRQWGTAAALLEISPIGVLMQTGEDATGLDSETDSNDESDQLTPDPDQSPSGASKSDQSPGDDANPESGNLGDDISEDTLEESIAVPTPVPAAGYLPKELQRLGFIWLFIVQAFILARLLLDPLMARRPLLDPNLTIGGLNFIGISLFIFMMANIVTSNPSIQLTQGPKLGPGYALMNMLPAIPTRPVSDALGGAAPPSTADVPPSPAQLTVIAKVLAIVAHLAIVIGIVLIGNRHFGNLSAGVGCAALYLLLPYTAQMTGRVDHAVPAALLLWALLMYRKPMIAGIFLGLACGLVYYPLFLLPLWFSFYWPRGAKQLAIGVVAMLGLLMVLLALLGTESLVTHLRQMFGLFSPFKEAHELSGIWSLGWNPMWRFPVIVGFVILSLFFANWPAQKNLGTLISGSAAVMVAAQFWHGFGGGLYIAWFLPLLLLTIFRPNLQDRVAIKVVDGPRIATSPRASRLEVESG